MCRLTAEKSHEHSSWEVRLPENLEAAHHTVPSSKLPGSVFADVPEIGKSDNLL